MDWVPVVFVTFKLLVLGTGMYFAIKWHYDQGSKAADKRLERRAVLRATGMAGGVFLLGLLCVGLLTYSLSTMLGVNLTLP